MVFNSEIHRRRSIRLKKYDYSQSGAYFVTVCTKNRKCLFGKIVDGNMFLNAAGLMLQMTWNAIPEHYCGIKIDEFVIMPNHIHGIIIILGAGSRACPGEGSSQGGYAGQPQGVAPTGRAGSFMDVAGSFMDVVGAGPRACPGEGSSQGGYAGQPQGVAPTLSLPDVVHRFKTITTRKYIEGVKQSGWARFSGKLWQRNYYEHVIRNAPELNLVREYIINNPRKWDLDRENPVNFCYRSRTL